MSWLFLNCSLNLNTHQYYDKYLKLKWNTSVFVHNLKGIANLKRTIKKNPKNNSYILGRGTTKFLIIHAKNIKLYHTAELCKPCHNLRDAQKSCTNKYSALQGSWIIWRCKTFASQRFLDTNHLKIQTYKFLGKWQRNKKGILKSYQMN